jgi:hypothetical protein
MLDLHVTALTFDLVVGDVLLVKEPRLAVTLHLLFLVVASPADLLRDRAVAFHHFHMTVLTRHASRQIIRVIEHPRGQPDLRLGRLVT